jgi:uncharacterized paraquat-inducible protein A
MGIKAHDMYVAALCPECHYALDQGKDMQKWEREELWLRAWRKTIYELFERGVVDVRAKHKWTMCKRCAGRIRKVVGRKLCNSCHKDIHGYLPNTVILGLVKKGRLPS